MHNKRKVILTVLSVVFLLSVIMGTMACAPVRRPGPVQPSPTPQPAPTVPVQESARAEALARKISDMNNVNSATVVFSGKSAWVGVDLAAKSENKMTNRMKNEITSTVKKEERNIDKVYVTADADTVTRLRNIARDIADGKPVSGFIKELNEIGRRITPSTK